MPALLLAALARLPSVEAPAPSAALLLSVEAQPPRLAAPPQLRRAQPLPVLDQGALAVFAQAVQVAVAQAAQAVQAPATPSFQPRVMCPQHSSTGAKGRRKTGRGLPLESPMLLCWIPVAVRLAPPVTGSPERTAPSLLLALAKQLDGLERAGVRHSERNLI